MATAPGPAAPSRTKLRPPHLTGDFVVRTRLLDRLDRLPALTLVTAPVGYGKTTLVTMWVTQAGLPCAWLSLDPADNEPAAYLLDVVAAVRTIAPEFGAGTVNLLTALSDVPVARAAAALMNELDALQNDFVLVLDDYHQVTSPVVHELVSELLSHPPRAAHIVIVSRHDPPIPQSLRMRGSVCEIRAHEIAFTAAETAEFLQKTLDAPVDAAAVSALLEQTEGWAASLRLATLYAKQRPDNLEWVDAVHSSGQYLIDYLWSAVLAGLPDAVFNFLISTAVLERLNGALCDYVLGDAAPAGRGDAFLQQLEAQQMFVEVLDEEGLWYRYHPLFRQLLQRLLHKHRSRSEINALYERASLWFEERDILEESLHYALASGNVANAVAIVRRHRRTLVNNLEFRRLDSWLRLFSPSAVTSEIDLLLIRAWLSHLRFQTDSLQVDLQRVEKLLALLQEGGLLQKEWLGEYAALRSVLCGYAGDVAATIHAGQMALDLLPGEWFYARGTALILCTLGHQMDGNMAAALQLIETVMRDPSPPRDLVLLRALQARLHLAVTAADLRFLRLEALKMVEMAEARGIKTTKAWGHYFYACACYWQNDLRSAQEHFQAVVDDMIYVHGATFTHGAIGLASTFQALGAPERAAATLEQAATHLAELQNGRMVQVIHAAAAGLAVRQGRLGDAERWLSQESHQAPEEQAPLFYAPELDVVKVLIAVDSEASLVSARALLMRHKERAVRLRRVNAQLQVLVLEAVLAERLGDRSQAVEAIVQALALAEPGGAVRVFADAAQQLSPLLKTIDGSAVPASFLAQVRTAVAIELESEAPYQEQPAVVMHHGGAEGDPGRQVELAARPVDPLEVLTFREFDVLRLLDQRLTNKEIAHELGIATETVKQHTVNVFRKLGVGNRRQAIVVARARGYIGGNH